MPGRGSRLQGTLLCPVQPGGRSVSRTNPRVQLNCSKQGKSSFGDGLHGEVSLVISLLMNFYRFPIFFSKSDSLPFAAGKACARCQRTKTPGTENWRNGAGQTSRNIFCFSLTFRGARNAWCHLKAAGTWRSRESACVERLWQGLVLLH